MKFFFFTHAHETNWMFLNSYSQNTFSHFCSRIKKPKSRSIKKCFRKKKEKSQHTQRENIQHEKEKKKKKKNKQNQNQTKPIKKKKNHFKSV